MNQTKAGLHSSIDDQKELAQKILAILDDPTKTKEMGQKLGRRLKFVKSLDVNF
ncbi:MAG: hypothetical protein ACNYWU_01565 [Desulfobacterales bacterium]